MLFCWFCVGIVVGLVCGVVFVCVWWLCFLLSVGNREGMCVYVVEEDG